MMRLSDIQGEHALDVLADILEPAAVIIADERVKEIWKSGQPKIRLAAYVCRAHKTEVMEILARLDGQDPETYTVNLLTLPKKVLEILSDPAILDLFSSQGQEND